MEPLRIPSAPLHEREREGGNEPGEEAFVEDGNLVREATPCQAVRPLESRSSELLQILLLPGQARLLLLDQLCFERMEGRSKREVRLSDRQL